VRGLFVFLDILAQKWSLIVDGTNNTNLYENLLFGHYDAQNNGRIRDIVLVTV